MLGTYRWFWATDVRDLEGLFQTPDYGSITLFKTNTQPPETLSGSMVYGTFTTSTLLVTHPRPVLHRYWRDWWNTESHTWEDKDLSPDGHKISLTEVQDDNGHPFLRFFVACGHGATLIAKPQTEETDGSSLTDEERERLAMSEEVGATSWLQLEEDSNDELDRHSPIV